MRPRDKAPLPGDHDPPQWCPLLYPECVPPCRHYAPPRTFSRESCQLGRRRGQGLSHSSAMVPPPLRVSLQLWGARCHSSSRALALTCWLPVGLALAQGQAASRWSWGHAPRPGPAEVEGGFLLRADRNCGLAEGPAGARNACCKAPRSPSVCMRKHLLGPGRRRRAQLSTRRTAGPGPLERSPRSALHRPPGRHPSGLVEVWGGQG